MHKFVTNVLEIVRGTLKDWQPLSQYHYKPQNPGMCTNIYKIRARPPHTRSFPDPIAIVMYKMPLPNLRARTRATGGFFNAPNSQSARLKLVNLHVRNMCRLVVDPRFQRLGLASKLVNETVEKQNVSLIEIQTPIDPTNQLFKKCGFNLYYCEAPAWYRRLKKMLKSIGLTNTEKLLPIVLQNRLELLDHAKRELAEYEIQQFLHHYKYKDHLLPTLERSKYIVNKLTFPEAYLLWSNPKRPFFGEKRADSHNIVSCA